MQELIEQLKEQAQFITDDDCAQDKFYRTGLRNAIKYAESMLGKEKEVIENAYDSGQESNWSEDMGLMGDWYYDETFNNE